MTLRIGLTAVALLALVGIGCSKGSAECAQAYDGLAQMVESMQKNLPGGKSNLPPKDQFVKACSELPKEVQQCMNMSYAMNHLQECQEAQKKVDPAKMQEVRAMMGKKG